MWRAQGEVLERAGRSLEQWRDHIGAMNQLVAGDITLAQTSQFWNSTRRGAASRIAAFEVAESWSCCGPVQLSPPSDRFRRTWQWPEP